MNKRKNNHRLKLETIMAALQSNDSCMRSFAMNASIGRKDVPLKAIWMGINDESQDVRTESMKACAGRHDVPLAWLLQGLQDKTSDVVIGALKGCVGRNDVPMEVIWRAANDPFGSIRAAAMDSFAGRKRVPAEFIWLGLNDDFGPVWSAIINAVGIMLPLPFIEQWIAHQDITIRMAGMRACVGRKDVPKRIILRGMLDSDSFVQASALEACAGRKDIPAMLIEHYLYEPHSHVRSAAVKTCYANGIPLLHIRDFEPPTSVYKKCMGGVIVTAEITKDACVNGPSYAFEEGCRASKAIIKDIIGDFFGEKVGISVFNREIAYYAGDEVIIDGYDAGSPNGPGFYFFCTREAAERF